MKRILIPASALLLAAACTNKTPDEIIDDGPLFATGSEEELEMAEDLAFDAIYDDQERFLNGVEEVFTKQVVIDEFGSAHVRLTQGHRGLNVEAADAVVHLDDKGEYVGFEDGMSRFLDVNTNPGFGAQQAIEEASVVLSELLSEELYGTSEFADSLEYTVTNEPTAALILRRLKGHDHLVYQVMFEVEVTTESGGLDLVHLVAFMDADSNKPAYQRNEMHSGKNRRVYDGNNGSSLPGTLTRSEGQGSSGDPTLDEAYDYAGKTYDYFNEKHGRDSYNNGGAELRVTVHHRTGYDNAFWNGSQMVFGDGSQLNKLVTQDVMSHELGHAVTEYTSDLVYANQSGALNEAMSDIYGAAADYYVGLRGDPVWELGDDVVAVGTPLRYMDNPTQDGSSYDYYPERYTGTQDGGGVHWNSGIANLAFYLLSEGGTHPRGKTSVVVPGIGIERAAEIFYAANVSCLTSGATFENARNCTAGAAGDDAAAVHLAWDAVGVPGSGSGGGGSTGGDLTNGVAETGLSASTGSDLLYTIDLPAGATNVSVVMSGGTGDADLYTRFGSAPTDSSYDCRPYAGGNNESCTSDQSGGTLYVRVKAYSTFSGVSLTASFDASTGGGYDPESGTITDISVARRAWVRYTLDVPAGASQVDFNMSGGTGDADLYVRFGSQPSTGSYDCRPYKNGNNEDCSLTAQEGTYHVGIRGYSAASNVTLQWSHQ